MFLWRQPRGAASGCKAAALCGWRGGARSTWRSDMFIFFFCVPPLRDGCLNENYGAWRSRMLALIRRLYAHAARHLAPAGACAAGTRRRATFRRVP